MSPRSRRVTATTVVVVVLIGVAVLIAAKAFAPREEPTATDSPAGAASTAGPHATASATPRAAASSTPPTAAPTAASEPTPTAATTTRTHLTVSYSGYDSASSTVQASGYIDLIETGGTCTLTLTSGSRTATGSNRATADATTTS